MPLRQIAGAKLHHLALPGDAILGVFQIRGQPRRKKIGLLVEAVVVRPLRAEWEVARVRIAAIMEEQATVLRDSRVARAEWCPGRPDTNYHFVFAGTGKAARIADRFRTDGVQID